MIRELFLENLSLWGCVWQSTLFAVMGLAGSFLLRRRPARACQVLILAMIAAVLVPTMSVLVKHFELGMFTAEPIALKPEVPNRVTVADYETPVAVPPTEIADEVRVGAGEATSIKLGSEAASIPWRMIMLYGWMIATLILLGRLFVAFVSGVCLLRRAQSRGYEQIQRAADSARARLGITKDLQVRSSRDIRSPVIWCWRPIPVLLVPGDLDHRVDWEGVICHELAHWKRRDHISGLIAELIVCILSWNPLLWWSKKRMVRLSEQACDDWVVAGGRPCEDYAQSLLNFKPQKQVAFVPAVVHSRRGLAGRVRRILKDSRCNPRAGAVWALAVSIMAAYLAVGVACAQTRPAKPESTTAREEKPTKSLHEAAADGDIEQVKLLISKGVDVNADRKTWGRLGIKPLHEAAKHGHRDVAELLIARGADVNANDKYGWTPLHWAAWYGYNKDIVELLIAKGADVNAKAKNGWTPLHWAAGHSYNKDIVELLIAKGADVNSKNKDGETPADAAIEGKGRFPNKMVKLLMAKGASVSKLEGVHLAAFLGDLTKVKSYIKESSDVNAKNKHGYTLLHAAAMTGQKQLLEFLIAEGADVNAKDKDSMTPIVYAAQRGHKDIAEILITEGADVNAKNRNGKTALHIAAGAGHKELMEILIAKGAEVNAEDKDSRTPLHDAAITGYREVVELLLAKGSDVNARLSINAKGCGGWMPLHWAA